MKINRIKKGYHYLNEDNVVVKTDWNENFVEEGNSHGGVGDSLGRNGTAAFCYDEDRKDIISGIKSFYTYNRTSPETGSHWYVSRYPRGFRYAIRGNSRDHVLISITSLIFNGEEDFVIDYVKNRAKRPCIDHGFTIDQKIWFKALFSNFWSWVYALIYLIKIIFRRMGIGLVRLLTFRHIGLISYTVDEFLENRPKPMNKWAEWVSKKQLIYPQYALGYGCMASTAIKSKYASRFIRILQRQFIDRGNLVLKGLCGIKITQEEIDKHIPIQHNRWSTRLDWTCDRWIRKYDGDYTDNTYEAFLFAIYNNQQKFGKWYALGKRNNH